MASQFILRPAQESDGARIRELVHVARINPMGLDWQRFIVAVASEGEVIGCGQVKPHRDGSRELASLVVAPGWRGRGVARAILEALIEPYSGTLYLTCRASLGPLYEKFGFRQIAASEMTPFFRRLSHLARLFEIVSAENESLLVMRRDSLAM